MHFPPGLLPPTARPHVAPSTASPPRAAARDRTPPPGVARRGREPLTATAARRHCREPLATTIQPCDHIGGGHFGVGPPPQRTKPVEACFFGSTCVFQLRSVDFAGVHAWSRWLSTRLVRGVLPNPPKSNVSIKAKMPYNLE
jgi:hypothetical protein